MGSSINKCSCCYWCEQCGGELPCDDFTPLNEQEDIKFYRNDLKERAEEYDSLIEEMRE